MKILFVTNEVPYPPDNGVRIVSHHAMRLMRHAGHQLGLAVLTEESDAVDARFEHMAKLCETGMTLLSRLSQRSPLGALSRSIRHRAPTYIARHECGSFKTALSELIVRFCPDVIHFDTIGMTSYVKLAPPGTGTVASINDSYSLTLENALSGLNESWSRRLHRRAQLALTRLYERTAYPRYGTVHVMSEIDAAYLRTLNPLIHTTVIPNGVDDSLLGSGGRQPDGCHLIFVAKIQGEHLANLQRFISSAWPAIRHANPGTQLHIVGAIDDNARAKLAGDGVIVRGYIDDLRDAYRPCSIAVVPVNKNCGIVNKAIEAMAAGLAVVGIGKAFSGVPGAIEGRHYLSAKDEAGMAEAISQLINDAPRRRKLQLEGRELAQRYYAWASRGAAYEAMYQAATERARRYRAFLQTASTSVKPS